MVYAELIFADNFAADVLIMALALHVSHTRVKIWKLVLSGVIGGAYAVAAAIWHYAAIIPVKFAVGAAMCAVHGVRPPLRFAANTGIFFGASFCAAGAAMLIGTSDGRGVYFDAPVIRYLLFAAAAAVAVFEAVSRGGYPKKDKQYRIEAVFGGKRAVFAAMLDTGNKIRDASGRSVIIADKSALESQIGDTVHFGVEFRVHTAGGRCTLKAAMPDELYVFHDGIKYTAKAYIAAADGIANEGISALMGTDTRMKRGGKDHVL